MKMVVQSENIGNFLMQIKALFILRFNVINLSVMSERHHRFLGFNQNFVEIMCLVQGLNTVLPNGIEPRTSILEVRSSTTTPPRSSKLFKDNFGYILILRL